MFLRFSKPPGGDKSKATELLGISRAALWRKLKKFRQKQESKKNISVLFFD
ncbi:MAG: hypothetical protein GY874_06050 [Desulfobacteraceae bacterium]|nr:hypothetical protein [Desulfobacteraceae bacterium]